MHEIRIGTSVRRPGLRSFLPAAAAVLLLVPAVGAAADAPRMTPADRLESAVLDELNLVRLEHGLRELSLSAQLTEAAETHSREMLAAGFFAHESRDGTSFARRIRGFYKPSAARRWKVGENLIWRARRLTARRAVAAWMASPGHRENLLAPEFREVGIAALRARGAPGVYGRRRVVVLTVDFGTR